MRGTMQSARQRPDLSVWERTLLPTTSSRIVPLQSGKDEEILSVVRSSETGDTEFRVTRLPDGTTGLIELSSSPSEVSWNSLRDTPTSSLETLCPYSTSVLMEQPQKLAHILEGMTDESTSDEWQPTRSTSVSSQVRTGFGSLLRTIFSLVSTIATTGRSTLA